MKASAADVLRAAARDRHGNEAFEKSLGRAVRQEEGTFQDYMDLIARVRARAERDGQGLVAAAKALADEGG